MSGSSGTTRGNLQPRWRDRSTGGGRAATPRLPRPKEEHALNSVTDALDKLVKMSRRLGDPARDYVILGEGNTSARIDAETFWVKASGCMLEGITGDSLVQVRFAPILELLGSAEGGDERVSEVLAEATVGGTGRRPSVETFLHALLLQLPDVNFIGHTHPTAVNAILCSQQAEAVIGGRLFPDEIVCCGVAPCFIPYTDPGLTLARRVRQEVEAFVGEHGERPKSILMQNHGLIALGTTAAEVESATAMWVKTARVLAGAMAFGGPRYFSAEETAKIHQRPDERYRENIIWGDGKRE
jgi:rhamnose utilization protein RhaD (predicted bifunctional aldolase and dehydrogenase)